MKPHNKDLFDKLIDQSKEWQFKDLKKANEFANKAFEIAKESDNPLLLGVAYTQLGTINLLSNDFEKSLSYYKKALSYFKKNNNTQKISAVMNNIGNIYFYQGMYHEASNYYEYSLSIKNELNDYRNKEKILNNLGIVYTKLGFYKLALEKFIESLKIREEEKDERKIATAKMNIGGLYLNLKDFKKAKKYLLEAKDVFIKNSDENDLDYLYSNLSIIYQKEKEFEKSIKAMEKALSFKKKIGNKVNISNYYLNIGISYYLWKKFDEAQKYLEKSYQLATKYSDNNTKLYSLVYLSLLKTDKEERLKMLYKALELAINANNKQNLLFVYQYLTNFYENNNNYVKAYVNYQKYMEIKDEIASENTNKYLMELQKKYDIEKKIKENELLKKENELLKLKIESEKKLSKAKKTIEIQNYKIELISRELSSKIQRNLIGNSKAIREVLNLAMTCAKYKDVSVLITGENGTGKEIIARIIHYSSPRKEYPFFPINSSAIPETLLESELFGHTKGAFTGADRDKKGIFELANHGTLFLDEIADMPFQLQSKLLRVLEDKTINKIGGNKNFKVDVRIISATNKNILELIDQDKFRIDLFHRINTIHIHIPPLRERPEDIEPILMYYVNFFSKQFNKPVPKIEKSVLEHLKQYDFPGNVRELKNIVERAIILSNEPVLTLNDFPIKLSDKQKNKTENYETEVEKIKKALELNDFNQSKAAKYLGISRDALIRKMKKYNLRIIRKII